jgi:outer membrane protein assembly factor BamB
MAAQTMAAFPGGAVLVGDPVTCAASRFEATTKGAMWSVVISLCEGIMVAAVAPDSVSYVRVRGALVAIDANGKQSWKIPVGDEPIPGALLAPAVTLDSRVVVATGSRVVVAFKNDGTQAWRFGVAEDEVLVASPMASRGEGIFLLTNHAVYNLGADGTLRFRRARAAS